MKYKTCMQKPNIKNILIKNIIKNQHNYCELQDKHDESV